MDKVIKDKEYYLRKKIKVSKEEYKAEIESRIERNRGIYQINLDEKLKKYKAKIDKEKDECLARADGYQRELDEMNK